MKKIKQILKLTKTACVRRIMVRVIVIFLLGFCCGYPQNHVPAQRLSRIVNREPEMSGLAPESVLNIFIFRRAFIAARFPLDQKEILDYKNKLKQIFALIQEKTPQDKKDAVAEKINKFYRRLEQIKDDRELLYALSLLNMDQISLYLICPADQLETAEMVCSITRRVDNLINRFNTASDRFSKAPVLPGTDIKLILSRNLQAEEVFAILNNIIGCIRLVSPGQYRLLFNQVWAVEIGEREDSPFAWQFSGRFLGVSGLAILQSQINRFTKDQLQGVLIHEDDHIRFYHEFPRESLIEAAQSDFIFTDKADKSPLTADVSFAGVSQYFHDRCPYRYIIEVRGYLREIYYLLKLCRFYAQSPDKTTKEKIEKLKGIILDWAKDIEITLKILESVPERPEKILTPQGERLIKQLRQEFDEFTGESDAFFAGLKIPGSWGLRIIHLKKAVKEIMKRGKNLDIIFQSV